jgi:hypothetical protein
MLILIVKMLNGQDTDKDERIKQKATMVVPVMRMLSQHLPQRRRPL